MRSDAFDYSEVEEREQVVYREVNDLALQTLLMDTAKRSVMIEAWGDLYLRDHVGLHQVHSRRASAAVTLAGRDGAIRFYFANNVCELLLMKFPNSSSRELMITRFQISVALLLTLFAPVC